MKHVFAPMLIAVLIIFGALIFFNRVTPSEKLSALTAGVGQSPAIIPSPPPASKSPEERIRDAKERSSRVKGLYMTADVANDSGAGATRLRNAIIEFADRTEINGIVIDVKEVCGVDYREQHLKNLLDDLHARGIWTIARIVTFKDASHVDAHPEWYLTRESPTTVSQDECAGRRHLRIKNPDGSKSSAEFWRDRRGGYWLDPAHPAVMAYIVGVGKRMIDMGFDELQFDYIRFPSDGDVANAMYPAWDDHTPKHEVMKSFFAHLNRELKSHKPEIILSADLFGYAALQAGDIGIGQRLEDIGSSFDYISFMVYPSHFYHGLVLPGDPSRGLLPVNFNADQVRREPDVTVGRSLQIARDFLDGRAAAHATSSAGMATSTPPVRRSHAKLRPWLEDFYHESDRAAGRPWGSEKVRLQIDAAEAVEPHGWLLWSAVNVYTENALNLE